jgi:hypothetical protein
MIIRTHDWYEVDLRTRFCNGDVGFLHRCITSFEWVWTVILKFDQAVNQNRLDQPMGHTRPGSLYMGFGQLLGSKTNIWSYHYSGCSLGNSFAWWAVVATCQMEATVPEPLMKLAFDATILPAVAGRLRYTQPSPVSGYRQIDGPCRDFNRAGSDVPTSNLCGKLTCM